MSLSLTPCISVLFRVFSPISCANFTTARQKDCPAILRKSLVLILSHYPYFCVELVSCVYDIVLVSSVITVRKQIVRVFVLWRLPLHSFILKLNALDKTGGNETECVRTGQGRQSSVLLLWPRGILEPTHYDMGSSRTITGSCIMLTHLFVPDLFCTHCIYVYICGSMILRMSTLSFTQFD